MGSLRIFLSHSHKDNVWCSAFVDELKRYGADVWYDKQGLYVGAKWRQTIETELEARDIFLLVLTPNSWASDWVCEELALALHKRKRIVSVLHQPTQVSGFITMYQMLNVIGLNSPEAAWLVAGALGLARQEPAPPAVVVEEPVIGKPASAAHASVIQAPPASAPVEERPEATGETFQCAYGKKREHSITITENQFILKEKRGSKAYLRTDILGFQLWEYGGEEVDVGLFIASQGKWSILKSMKPADGRKVKELLGPW